MGGWRPPVAAQDRYSKTLKIFIHPNSTIYTFHRIQNKNAESHRQPGPSPFFVRRERYGNEESIRSTKEEKKLMNNCYYRRNKHLSILGGLIITVAASGLMVGVLYIVGTYFK